MPVEVSHHCPDESIINHSEVDHGYGGDISAPWYCPDQGLWLIGNEYVDAIRYCPWCGVDLWSFKHPSDLVGFTGPAIAE